MTQLEQLKALATRDLVDLLDYARTPGDPAQADPTAQHAIDAIAAYTIELATLQHTESLKRKPDART